MNEINFKIYKYMCIGLAPLVPFAFYGIYHFIKNCKELSHALKDSSSGSSTVKEISSDERGEPEESEEYEEYEVYEEYDDVVSDPTYVPEKCTRFNLRKRLRKE